LRTAASANCSSQITRTTRGADTNARDAAIAFSFAVQHGADPEAIRRALCRDAKGNASGPLGAALDIIAEGDEPSLAVRP
jgi:hypothetical protein